MSSRKIESNLYIYPIACSDQTRNQIVHFKESIYFGKYVIAFCNLLIELFSNIVNMVHCTAVVKVVVLESLISIGREQLG